MCLCSGSLALRACFASVCESRLCGFACSGAYDRLRCDQQAATSAEALGSSRSQHTTARVCTLVQINISYRTHYNSAANTNEHNKQQCTHELHSGEVTTFGTRSHSIVFVCVYDCCLAGTVSVQHRKHQLQPIKRKHIAATFICCSPQYTIYIVYMYMHMHMNTQHVWSQIAH